MKPMNELSEQSRQLKRKVMSAKVEEFALKIKKILDGFKKLLRKNNIAYLAIRLCYMK